MNKLGCGCASLLVVFVIGPVVFLLLLTPSWPAASAPGYFQGQATDLAKQDIPPEWLSAMLAAGSRYRVPWAVIAGIGKVETDFGRSALPGVHDGANFAGAEGPMQFEPSTWAAYGVDCGGGKNVYDPRDAICGAANYLAASGAAMGNVPGAVFAYNHADWYVAQVLTWAGKYAIQTTIQAVGGLIIANLPAIDGVQLAFGDLWKPIFDSVPQGGYPVSTFPWGQCTWFVASERPVTWSGNAADWKDNAKVAGRAESAQPAVGAIVVWPAGVGYSEFGHVAVVVAVDGSSYTVAESNYLGLGKIDLRRINLPDPAEPVFVQ